MTDKNRENNERVQPTDNNRKSNERVQPTDINMKAVSFALVAALLYGISAPVSKVLLEKMPPTFMASLLYLGAGIGMLFVSMVRSFFVKTKRESKITRKELPFIIGMIILDIAAPILLMIGLTLTTSSNASLLNNFEIVATSVIALFIFKEAISRRLWIAIVLITVASIILSFNDVDSISFSWGSMFVVLACIAWGFENNCTRMLSIKDPVQIVIIKGIGSGIGSLFIASVVGELGYFGSYIIWTLLLGFIAFGMSILLYIRAQRDLGAARTSAFYAAAPFIGVIVSWLILREALTLTFYLALFIMLLGTYFAVSKRRCN